LTGDDQVLIIDQNQGSAFMPASRLPSHLRFISPAAHAAALEVQALREAAERAQARYAQILAREAQLGRSNASPFRCSKTARKGLGE
jgi:hypothetical protein